MRVTVNFPGRTLKQAVDLSTFAVATGFDGGDDDNDCSSPPAAAALQSIFPQTELGAFMVLLKKEKEQQLNELSTIVTGIRLFNTASEEDSEQNDLLQPSTFISTHQPKRIMRL